MRLKPVRDQVAVVVGASSGIGRATALALARHGARVVASARGAEGLETLVEEIRDRGGDAIAVAADAEDSAAMERLAAEAAERYGRVDTWVHAAAVSLYARFEDTDPDEFRQVVATNLLGQMHGARAALPHIRRAGGGALIHVTSVEAEVSLPYQSAYAASKHGIVGMLDALRLELRREGAPIAVTNIMPSSIDTPLFDQARTKLGVRPKGVPPQYPPEEVARAILYAAEIPTRDLVVGGGGRMLVYARALSPRLADAFLVSGGFETQKTDAWRSVRHPDALEEPLDEYDEVEGTYDGPRRSLSLYNRFRTGSFALPLLVAGAGAALGFLMGRDGDASRAGDRHREGHDDRYRHRYGYGEGYGGRHDRPDAPSVAFPSSRPRR